MKKIRNTFFFALLIFSGASFGSSFGRINVPVANMYDKADIHGNMTSQAIYNENIEILANKDQFIKIKTPDSYEGWVEQKEVTKGEKITTNHLATVNNLFANIYKEPDTTTFRPIITVPFNAKLDILELVNDRWLKVSLVDGQFGFIQKGDVVVDANPLSIPEMLEMSTHFIGLPYLWGGRSTFGYDCSAFVQMLYEKMGIILPRDASLQIKSPLLVPVDKKDLRPGDLMYFGLNGQVSHASVYLGHGNFIGSTAHLDPIVQISSLRDPYWNGLFITARRLAPFVKTHFQSEIRPLSQTEIALAQKYTYRKSCPTKLTDLRAVTVTYLGFDNLAHQGTLIVNKIVASEVAQIFAELYRIDYPIKQIKPIEFYQGDDEASMHDNNTSAFCCRQMVSNSKFISAHSYGMAIDLNPLLNPYVEKETISPKNAYPYLRRDDERGKISYNSPVIQIFKKYHWEWGGNFPSVKDFQHFEKH